jgi:hypothetical protein
MFACALALAAAWTTQAWSQNVFSQHDGTDEFASRGTVPTAHKGLFQRLPADQIAGGVAIKGIVLALQDFNLATSEGLTVEVRRNAAAAGSTGAPDVSPAGLLGSIVVPPITFPSFSPVILTVTFPPGSGVALPATGAGVPGDDVYVGATMIAQPNWPSDGLAFRASGSTGFNFGEQFRASAVGYTGFPGIAGLGWEVFVPAGTASVVPDNFAWRVGTLFDEDVLWPFAHNPGVFTQSPPFPAGVGTGANPNFGYARIWPDPLRGDSLGFVLESQAAPGALVILAFDFAASTPAIVPGFAGRLFLNPSTLAILDLGAVLTTPQSDGTGSRASVGPFSLAGLAGLGSVFFQSARIELSPLAQRLSLGAKVNF